MIARISRFAACIALATAWASGALEFAGYMYIGEQSRFVIKDVEQSRSSGWVAIGDSFGEYTLLGFDRNTDVLSLGTANAVIHLRLKASRVAAANSMTLAISRRLDVSVRDDGQIVMLGRTVDAAALRAELTRVATVEPQPVIAVSYPRQSGESGLRTILNACRTIGLVFEIQDRHAGVL